MVEGASLEWIEEATISHEDLRELLVAAYVALLTKAIELDPKAAPRAM